MLGSLVRVAMKVAAHSTPLEGALNSLYCATNPLAPALGQGRFFVPVGKLDGRTDGWLGDRKLNAELWNQSEAQRAKLK